MNEQRRQDQQYYNLPLGNLPMRIGQKNYLLDLEKSLEGLWSKPENIKLLKSLKKKKKQTTWQENSANFNGPL